MEDIVKIVIPPQESGLLIKGASKRMENEVGKRSCYFACY